MTGRGWLIAAAFAMGLVGTGCTRPLDAASSRTQAVREFDRHPIYWVGERFEKWELDHVDLDNPRFVTLIYGTCEIDDPDGAFGPEGGSCAPPLQMQISPLCSHLEAVARAPIWKRRRVRGAPVGTVDSAPVLLTDRVQVKVYRGQGSSPGLPMRALRALRSANDVPPVVGRDDPIPAPAPGVLEGARPCPDDG